MELGMLRSSQSFDSKSGLNFKKHLMLLGFILNA